MSMDDNLEGLSIKEIKAKLKKKIKSISIKMRYKDYRLIKRNEKQMERRAQDYVLNTWNHENRRSEAELKRQRKNNKRKNNV